MVIYLLSPVRLGGKKARLPRHQIDRAEKGFEKEQLRVGEGMFGG